MLANCWVTYSNFQIVATVIIVSQPGGSGLHMCVDYSGLNAITPRDLYPVPYMGESINQIHAFSVFTNLEVASGLPPDTYTPRERQIRAFVTMDGLFITKL